MKEAFYKGFQSLLSLRAVWFVTSQTAWNFFRAVKKKGCWLEGVPSPPRSANVSLLKEGERKDGILNFSVAHLSGKRLWVVWNFSIQEIHISPSLGSSPRDISHTGFLTALP